MIKAFSHIIKQNGITALWRGFNSSVMVAVLGSVVYFNAYETLKSRAVKNDVLSQYTALPGLFSGFGARAFSTMILSPLELVRTIQQGMTGSEQRGILNQIQMIKNQCGGSYSCFYRGLGPTLWRDVPFSGIIWMIRDTFAPVFDDILKQTSENESFRTWSSNLLCGFLGGAIATTISQPFDVVKTRKQVFVNKALCADGLCETESRTMNRGSIGMLLDIEAREGFQSLYAGFKPRLLKIVPACGIMLSSYELGKKKLQKED
mmetsp:Transcript_30637/g.34853  ORF Transcript_30637/g.34853 Transcript_30637/m.34853 type:complete len:262 (-) Transcript_30637:386-1171(-)